MKFRSILTVTALILIMFMAAIETSIISLALPTIKINLHAGNLVSLVFTVYFIALVIANPIEVSCYLVLRYYILPLQVFLYLQLVV